MDVRGAEHAKCATYCANLGMPLGVLEAASGRICLIVPKGHADPKEGLLCYLGRDVEVQGTVQVKGGMQTVQITAVKEV